MLFWLPLISFVLIVIIVKVYLQLTSGICRSNAHMVGKVVIITGGSSGIGLETAKNLAERGAKVIIACRSVRRAAKAIEEIIKQTGNTNVHHRQLDLASLKSVRRFCSNIYNTEKRLDVLINNAAAGGLGSGKTEDGLHKGMQVNYFGPFLLTCLLVPLLKSSAPSRIINVSSSMHKYGEMDFENLNMERYWSDHLVYANSKLFLNLMTLELSRRLRGINVTANCLHPGVTATTVYKNIKNSVIREIVNTLVNFLNKDLWQASQTCVYLAVSPEVANISGRYFSDCREKKPSLLSQDLELAKRLWIESENLVDYKLPIE
ncbi:Retinol dehydrogenase 13 [Papilio xuthus]|uniref:Retinol dehydrogenase 13 n=1 Tax=Papilio xuthus TaxID=66420 RepID=A0A0N0PAN9_PAPXU|nr:Retinol dehydrogenase 13 [Papilio xuthus]